MTVCVRIGYGFDLRLFARRANKTHVTSCNATRRDTPRIKARRQRSHKGAHGPWRAMYRLPNTTPFTSLFSTSARRSPQQRSLDVLPCGPQHAAPRSRLRGPKRCPRALNPPPCRWRRCPASACDLLPCRWRRCPASACDLLAPPPYEPAHQDRRLPSHPIPSHPRPAPHTSEPRVR